jgi:hypothetical protein
MGKTMRDDLPAARTADGAGGESRHADDAELLEDLRELLDAAVAGQPSQGPGRARTSVAISIRDDGGAPTPWAVLRLDRQPVAVEPGGGSAEIQLTFPRETLREFLRGDRQLALTIARGEVEFRGPVRKFLRITPVLRALARGGGPTAPRPGFE